MALYKTDPPTLISVPPKSMLLCPVQTSQFSRDSPQAPGHPNHPLSPTPLIPHMFQCLTLPLTQIILDSPPLENPLPFYGPWSLLWATWANSPVEGLPMADPLDDGAWLWTTSPPSTEMETITIITTMPGPHSKLKTHRMILAMHWLGEENLTFKSPNLSLAVTHRSGLEDTLDHGPDPNVFCTLATLLCTTVLTLDNLPAHLPSHSSTILLLCTTLSFSNNSISTLVDSGTMDNFINESLAVLASYHLQCLPTPIPLKL
ncbi:hypothetical protein E4T56_gene13782 [Termitomyces sp. T112]|nr:hypothetical protein E4T56_gene13782 [Termitomyces sp. T112]